MAIDLPGDISRKTRKLGEPIAQFHTSMLQAVLYFVVGILAILLGLALGGFVVYSLLEGDDAQHPFLKASLFALVLLAAGVGSLVKWRHMLGAGVIAFEDGLARFKGSDCQVLRWQDVEVVRRGKPEGHNEPSIGTSMRLTLVGTAGREWVFTETLKGLKDFRDLVEERTLAHLLPGALEDLDAGRTLSFGDVTLDPAGLTFAGQPFLPWERVEDIRIEKGKVVVTSTRAKGPYCKVPIFQVPNAHLLVELSRRLSG
jgi:hypothetical protein